MKVLFLTNSLDYGGIETNLVLLTEEFRKSGDQVHIAARPGPLRQSVIARGATVHDLEMRFRSPSALLKDRRRLRLILREIRPDVIHVFSASAAVLLRSLIGGKPPVITSIMGLGDHPFEADWRVQARNLLTIQGANRILLISPAIEEHVRRLPVADKRLVQQDVVGIRLPDPMLRSAAHRQRIRDELGLTINQPAIMTTGRLAVRKAHGLFIDAAALIHRARPKARFFIIGEGPKRNELEAQIKRLGLAGVVTLLGEVDDVQEYHAAADVYVRPGISEGFVGITVLEAQALEVPVVSYDTEDVKLAIQDGRTGRLVPNGDSGAMAKAILTLLEHPVQAAAMALAGRHAVEQRFDISIIAKRLRETYHHMADQRSPPNHPTRSSTPDSQELPR